MDMLTVSRFGFKQISENWFSSARAIKKWWKDWCYVSSLLFCFLQNLMLKYFYIIMWHFLQWKHWSFSVNHLIILCLKKSANKLTIILLNLSVVNMKFLFVNALFVLTKIVNNVFVLSDLLAHECYIGVQLNYWIIQISLFTWGNCFLLKQFRLNKLLELCLMSNWVYKLD